MGVRLPMPMYKCVHTTTRVISKREKTAPSRDALLLLLRVASHWYYREENTHLLRVLF